MATPELDIDLGKKLPPRLQDPFYSRRFITEGRTYSLSGPETPASILARRQETATQIADSLNEARAQFPPSQQPPLASLYATRDPGSPTIGIAARVELDRIAGQLFPVVERSLRYYVTQTIKRSSEDHTGDREIIEGGIKLIVDATRRRFNLLCLFTLGGFFACLVRRQEETLLSPRGKLLVTMPNQDISELVHPTELDSLYFLLMVKQGGEDRVTAVPPAEWVAFINYGNFLLSRRLNMDRVSTIQAGPIERAWETTEKGSGTPLVIPMPHIQFNPKPRDSKPPLRSRHF